MSQSAEAKLHELRDKTNRELVSLISNKLDRGLAFVRVLEGIGVDEWTAREDFTANAENAYAEASKWMSLLHEATPQERSRLDFKLTQLRTALDHARRADERVCAAS